MLSPAPGSKKKSQRVGRGIGSGLGKTCGRGHKGQHSRSGSSQKPGFEGGQMPLQRRLPKWGFTSLNAHKTTQLGLKKLASLKFNEEVITLSLLKKQGIVSKKYQCIKIIADANFKLEQPLQLKGLKVTQSVRQSIELAGGTVEA